MCLRGWRVDCMWRVGQENCVTLFEDTSQRIETRMIGGD